MSFTAAKGHILEDSLRLVLSKNNLPRVDRITTLGKLAHFTYYRRSSREALDILQEALSLSRLEADPGYTARLYAQMATQFSGEGNAALADQYLDSALHYSRLTENQVTKGYVHYCEGWMKIRQNEPQKAIASFLLGSRHLEGKQAYPYESRVYAEMSNIYGQWADLPNQEKYAQLSLQAAKRSYDPDVITSAYHTMANSFIGRFRTDTTKHFLIDSALFYNKQTVQLLRQNRDRIVHITELSVSARNIAAIYREYMPSMYQDTAHYYLDIAIEEAARINDYAVLADSHVIQAQYAIADEDFQWAEMLLVKATMALHQAVVMDNEIETKILHSLAIVLEKKGDLEGALQHYKLYIEAYANLFDVEKMSLSKRLEAQYEAGKKEKELAVLHQQMLFNKKLNRAYMAFILTSLLTVLFLFYAYKQRVKAMKQQGLLHQMEMNEIRQEYRISMLSAMLDGQEQERSRLARDLHDGLGGLLSGIKIELSSVLPMLKDTSYQQLFDRSLLHLDAAMNELRRIAHSMMPEILMRYGLDEATYEYCQKLKHSGVNIQCQVYHYTNKMDPSRQIVLYRIMQELVNNAIKHAHASSILVQLQQVDSTITLTVEDDGVGFDKDELAEKGGGAGLANIRSRVEFLNGTLDFYSEKDTGTTVTIECTET